MWLACPGRAEFLFELAQFLVSKSEFFNGKLSVGSSTGAFREVGHLDAVLRPTVRSGMGKPSMVENLLLSSALVCFVTYFSANSISVRNFLHQHPLSLCSTPFSQTLIGRNELFAPFHILFDSELITKPPNCNKRRKKGHLHPDSRPQFGAENQYL